jgi:uncharacterized membrane protein
MMEINPPVLVCVLCGLIYIITGLVVLRYPPKKINDFYGYRTSRSKKSQAHWDYAQKESSKYIIQSGYYCLLTCALFILFETGKAGIWIAIILTTLYPFISVIQTEKALKKKFS